MRIGIFGGTFNPIHIGHLRSAEEVREKQQLDRILFVPSASPPHKAHSALALPKHRLTMVRKAIAGNPSFSASSIETRRSGHSYSVDTLELLHRAHPRVAFAFILGIDAFREIATWKDFQRLFELADFVVTSRATYDDASLPSLIPVAAQKYFCYRSQRKVLEHHSGHTIVFQRVSDLALSSSEIRDRLRRAESIRYLVPRSVENYIRRHRLYRIGSR